MSSGVAKHLQQVWFDWASARKGVRVCHSKLLLMSDIFCYIFYRFITVVCFEALDIRGAIPDNL